MARNLIGSSDPNIPRSVADVIMRCAETGENPVAAMRSLAPLPDNAQRIVDQAVVSVGLQRMAVVAEVMAAGLIYNLPNWLSVLELYWQKISRQGTVRRTMLPNARGENSLPDRTPAHLPIFCTVEDFDLNIRLLAASRRAGAALDTTGIENAVLNENEAFEDQAINGANIQSGGYTAPGLLNAPNVNSQAYSGGEAWTATGHTGEVIQGDLFNMIGKLQTKKRFGPYTLFVPTTYGLKLQNDFKANSDLTIQQRLEENQFGGRGIKVVTADFLPTDQTILVNMSKDVLDVVMGQAPTSVSWQSGDGWQYNFAILGCIILRVKDDYDGNSGICKGNLT